MSGTRVHFDRYSPVLRWFGAFWCLANVGMLLLLVRDGFDMLGVPLAFLGVGVLFTFGRYRLTIDAAQRSVVTELGWLVFWIGVRRIPVSTFQWVTLRLVATRSQNSTSLSYAACLVGPTLHYLFAEHDDLFEARAEAERIAKLLGLGVSDEVTQSGFREPGSLDEPLAHRLARAPALPPLGPPPTRLRVETAGEELRVTLPRARAFPQLTLALSWGVCGFIGCMPAVIWASGLGHPSVLRDPVLPWALSLLGLPFVVVALIVAWREVRGMECDVLVRVSPRELRAEVVGPGGRRDLALSARELESIGVGHRTRLGWLPRRGPPRIIAAGDRTLIDFGVSCTPEEHAWLIRAMHWYLRAPLIPLLGWWLNYR